jgi:hypothetical protein
MRTVKAGRSQNRFGRWKYHHHCTGREYRAGRKRRREESATREENAVGDQISVGKKVLVRLRFIHIMQRFKLYDCRDGKTLRY